MTRNMDHRVEILFPILSSHLKEKIDRVLELILMDNVKAREQNSSGHYHYVERNADEIEINSQLILSERPYSINESKARKLHWNLKIYSQSNR